MTMVQKAQIGFIGLGAMGQGMAGVLLRAGMMVRGYDINPRAVEKFVAAGGLAASSPAEAAQEAAVLILMVVSGEQAEAALFGDHGAVTHLQPGSVVMLCCTVEPERARKLGERLATHHIQMLDAPVSGGIARAAEGALSVMASGSDVAFRLCEPVLAHLAQHVYHLGDQCGQGSTMKMVNQLLAGVHIATTAEALALGVRAGIDPQRIFEVISNSAGNSWMFQNRGPTMLSGAFTPPKSAVEIFVKDLGIVLETGKQLHFPLPIAAAAHQLFLMAAAAGYGRLDDAAVVKVFEQLAGIHVSATPKQDNG
jgi:3-hydroxyisobutyrate dehydrogenase